MKKYNNPNQYENFKEGISRDVPNIAVNMVLAPISLFVLVCLLGGLVAEVFGKNSDWGPIPRILVAVGVPTLVIAAVSNVRIGNAIFIIWYCLFWGSIAIGFLGTIIYASFKNYFELF